MIKSLTVFDWICHLNLICPQNLFDIIILLENYDGLNGDVVNADENGEVNGEVNEVVNGKLVDDRTSTSYFSKPVSVFSIAELVKSGPRLLIC